MILTSLALLVHHAFVVDVMKEKLGVMQAIIKKAQDLLLVMVQLHNSINCKSRSVNVSPMVW